MDVTICQLKSNCKFGTSYIVHKIKEIPLLSEQFVHLSVASIVQHVVICVNEWTR